MSAVAYELVGSPVGELLVLGDESGLRGLHMQEGPAACDPEPGWTRSSALTAEAADQLGEYFAGERAGFDLPLSPQGSDWQRRVWRASGEIPYGERLSYGAIAARLGRPHSARAVGLANAANPLSILIPCHRLVGSGGKLTGYAGGLERKRALLDLEAGAGPPAQRLYTLLGGDREPYSSALPATLGGHRRNRVYGRLDCAGARSWIARGHYVRQRVFFSDEAMAVAAGFRPCGGCMRERYAVWKAGR